MIEQIEVGQYPEDFEDEDLAGSMYVGIRFTNNADKTHKLSVHNSYTRTTDFFRLPVNYEDPENLGASILRYLEKTSPGQKRFYCKVASPAHKQALAAQGYPKAEFFANRPLGENTIRKLMCEAAKLLGLPPDFKGHSLRHVALSKAANDPSVSLAETMRLGRHSSAAAAKNYQRVDGISEGNRMRALGILPAKKNPPVPSMKSAEVLTSSKKDEGLVTPSKFASAPSVCKKKVPLFTEGLKFPVIDKRGSLTQEDIDLIENFKPTEQQQYVYEVDEGDDDQEWDKKPAAKEGYDGNDDWSPAGSNDGSPSINLIGRDGEEVSMTQKGIEALQGEIADVRDIIAEKKRPVMSENQYMLRQLKSELDSLKKKLRDRESDEELYYDSLERDFDKDRRSIISDLEKERVAKKNLQRENEQLRRMLQRQLREKRDGSRGGNSNANACNQRRRFR